MNIDFCSVAKLFMAVQHTKRMDKTYQATKGLKCHQYRCKSSTSSTYSPSHYAQSVQLTLMAGKKIHIQWDATSLLVPLLLLRNETMLHSFHICWNCQKSPSALPSLEVRPTTHGQQKRRPVADKILVDQTCGFPQHVVISSMEGSTTLFYEIHILW